MSPQKMLMQNQFGGMSQRSPGGTIDMNMSYQNQRLGRSVNEDGLDIGNVSFVMPRGPGQGGQGQLQRSLGHTPPKVPQSLSDMADAKNGARPSPKSPAGIREMQRPPSQHMLGSVLRTNTNTGSPPSASQGTVIDSSTVPAEQGQTRGRPSEHLRASVVARKM